jgi:ABC-type sugar transport system permease subunit
VDKELYEAATVDGANRWQQFLHVTLPGIRHVAIFVVVLATIGSFQLFELPFMMLNGGTGANNAGLTIVMYLYNNGFVTGDLGYASAVGWTLALGVMGIAVVQMWLSGAFRKEA